MNVTDFLKNGLRCTGYTDPIEKAKISTGRFELKRRFCGLTFVFHRYERFGDLRMGLCFQRGVAHFPKNVF